MIDCNSEELSVRQQCDLLGLNRSTLYYQEVPVSDETVRMMNRIDEIYTKCPFYGSRKIALQLASDGYSVGRDKVRTLMSKMAIAAIYPKPNLSKKSSEHRIYPYLLKGVTIDHVNQVWSTDITYIRLKCGFVYLAAVIDWFSRYVLSWTLSTSLDVEFCIEALQIALGKANPEIFNTDQGSQFTSQKFTSVLESKEIRISMDGKGRVFDNIFVERLWRSVKYEDIYIKDYMTPKDLGLGLSRYFDYYNCERFHQSLDYKTPQEVYHVN